MKKIFAVFSLVLFASIALSNQSYREALEEAEAFGEVCGLAFEILDYPIKLGNSIQNLESLENAEKELEDFKSTLEALAARLNDFADLSEEERKLDLDKFPFDHDAKRLQAMEHRKHLSSLDAEVRDAWMHLMQDYSEVFRKHDPVFRIYLSR